MKYLEKILSGGQTGADEASLFAAKKFGLETGGWIPKGFLTENGSNTKLGTEYGLIETENSKYPPRTKLNVQNSDATLRFANNFNTAGERCTLKCIKELNKPYLDIHVYKPLTHEEVARWLIDNKVKVLNVAGNRESTCKGIFEYTVNFLTEVFGILNSL